ncbi:MAG: hypothetical protein HPZ91_05910 [Lentisphaeria bacterium]|nr:hypothetical protein [Lentisphaeria bacterium]
MADYIFIDRDGGERKLDAGALLRRLSRGRLRVTDPVREEGETEFCPLKDDPALGPAAAVLECENWLAARRLSVAMDLCCLSVGVLLAVLALLMPRGWKVWIFTAAWLYPVILVSVQFRRRWPRLPSRRMLRRGLLLMFPYVNLLAGPAAGFAMFRHRRVFFTVGWAAFTLAVAGLWLLPPEPEARFYPAILILFAYGAAFVLQLGVTRMARLRLAAVRRAAGFGEPPPWYRPLPRRSSPLLPFWKRRGRPEMRLFTWSISVVFLSIGVYAAVLYGVGAYRLAAAEEEVRALGLPVTNAGLVTEQEREAAALFDSIELPPFPGTFLRDELMAYPYLYGEYDTAYRRSVQRYFDANHSQIRKLKGVWELGATTLPDTSFDNTRERRRKIKILAKLFDPGLRQEFSQSGLPRRLRFIHRLEALDEGYRCMGFSVNLTAKYAAAASEETLYSEAAFWTLRESRLRNRMLNSFWRSYLDRLDRWERDLDGGLRFYRPGYRAARLRRMLAQIPYAVWEYGGGKSPAEGELRRPDPFDASTFTIESARMHEVFCEALARIRAARTGIAAELYRRKHGAWPERLDELVPEFLSSVPNDPFSGKRLLFRSGLLGHAAIDIRFRDGEFAEDFRESTVNGFRVYSVGPDQVDDGGRSWHNGSTRDISFTVF